jgi:hypothetical protein
MGIELHCSVGQLSPGGPFPSAPYYGFPAQYLCRKRGKRSSSREFLAELISFRSAFICLHRPVGGGDNAMKDV